MELTPVDHDPFADAAPTLERIPPQMNVPAQHQWGAQAGANVLGNVTGISDAAKAWRGEMTPQEQQDFAINAAMGAIVPGAKGLGTAVKAAEETAPAVAKGIRAYHGSPYDFDRFDLSKIGTGEGAQAYGHGLYFAENPATAEEYAKALRPALPTTLPPKWLTTAGPAMDAVQDVVAPNSRKYLSSTIEDALAARQEKSAVKGVYEVSLNADPDHFLHWDKPLSEQSEHVQKALLSIPEVAKQEEFQKGFLGKDKGLTGASAYAVAAKWQRGADLSPANPAELTEKLRDAGIPGIKYLDQGSRATGATPRDLAQQMLNDYKGDRNGAAAELERRLEGATIPSQSNIPEAIRLLKSGETLLTHNYVVFDDKMVNIIKKYGIAGLIAGGAGHFSTTPVDGDPFAKTPQRKWGGRVPADSDAGKRTHASVHYVAKSQTKGEKCGLCSMFQRYVKNGPACTAVGRPIAAAGHCILFDRKAPGRKAGSRCFADGGDVTEDTAAPANLLDQAREQYPILRSQDYGYVENFSPNSGYLEHWEQGEPGEAATPNQPLNALRPNGLPLDKPGLEIRDPTTRPIDVLGDIVSHNLVNTDPTIKQYYQDFQSSLESWQKDRLQQQYQSDKANYGETRPYNEWEKASGMPAYFRGYPFQQWSNFEEMYTPDQMKKLDSMMNYLRGSPGQRRYGGRTK